MKKINFIFGLLFCFSFVFCFLCWNVPFKEILQAQNIVILNNEDISQNNDFGNYVTAIYDSKSNKVKYKLFNTITLKTVNASVIDKKYVYLGGDAYGFVYNGDGVLVVGKNKMMIDELFKNNINDELQEGDIIKEVNDTPVYKASDIAKVLNNIDDEDIKNVIVKGVRKNKNFTTEIKPAYDILTKKYKLGVWVKESMSGIGTLTYIDVETNRFGALGHPLIDVNTNSVLDVKSGQIYNCDIIGIHKSIRGSPGELQGVLRANDNVGSVDKNCSNGIFGYIDENKIDLANRQLIEIGNKNDIQPGKAYIYTSLDGKNIRPYEIEIIKTNYRSSNTNSNLVIRVTDERLVSLSGGIVQGMSGSPIVQNNKLIGAVTHVFINDATKGFGLTIDEMLKS